MRILILTYFFPPAYSGEATYVSELASGLLEQGHDVQVIAASPPGKREAAPSWVRFVDLPDVSRTSQFERFRELFTGALLEAAREATGGRQWNVVHVQEWFCAEAALILARRLRIPLVKTIHFVPPQKMTTASVRWQLADAWLQRCCSEADELIAVGHDLKDNAIARYGLSPHKISVVHNGVSAASLHNVQAPDIENPRQPLAVTVGRLVEQKGIDLLLQSIPLVLAQNPAVRWVVCGGGPAQGAIPSEFLEASARWNGAVQFTGHLSRPAALGWIAAADFVVAPARFEPFGIGVLEAMLLGKPVIASAVGGPKEMLAHNHSGLLVPVHDAGGWAEVDPAGLAQAQLTLLSDRQLAQALGKQAQREALTRFAYSGFIANTLAVFEKAIARRGRFKNAVT